MDKLKANIKEFLLELFFPSFCLGCRQEGVLLCQDCKATLDISEYDYCLCERNPMRLAPPAQGKPQGKCPHCPAKKLSGLFSALPYQEKQLTKTLIYQFKYPPHIKNLAKPLAGALAEHFLLTGKNTEDFWQNSVLIPVPMDIKKQKKRGYNQAQELARELSDIISVPVIFGNLVKIKATAPQVELSAKERQVNLKGAFAIKNPVEFAGKNVFLVDDVYTTGSTMEECANVLRTCEAKSVFGVCIAREG